MGTGPSKGPWRWREGHITESVPKGQAKGPRDKKPLRGGRAPAEILQGGFGGAGGETLLLKNQVPQWPLSPVCEKFQDGVFFSSSRHPITQFSLPTMAAITVFMNEETCSVILADKYRLEAEVNAW